MKDFDTLLLALSECGNQYNRILCDIYDLAKQGNRDAKIFLMPYKARIQAYESEVKSWDSSTQVKAPAQAEAPTKVGR